MLDQFDIQLLKLLQENNQYTAKQLSEQVNLSPVSCLRRVRRLRDSGVILKDVSIINPELVGRKMSMIVLVTLEQERPDLIDAFKRAMIKTPEVMQCHYVTGEVDFVLYITIENMEKYEIFTRDFFFNNKNIKRFTTLAVMNRVKFGTSVPLDGIVDLDY